jgi:hypothetical protein
MPEGLVRSGDFRNGTPIILPHQFGNPVGGSSEPFGSPQPQSNIRMAGNPVRWLPSPAHFGNQVSFLTQVVPPSVVIAPGKTGTVNINVTNLLGTNSVELTSFGEPAGVTVTFAPNPDTGTAVATITVASSVPGGRYTITVVGTVTSPNIEYTQLHLVVAAGGSAPPPPTPPTFIASIAAFSTAFGGTNSTTGAAGGASSIDTTGATLFVAFIRAHANDTSVTVTDSQNNTWSLGPISTPNFVPQARLAWVSNPITSTAHQFHTNGSDNENAVEVFAFSSSAGTWVMDTHAESTGSVSGAAVTTDSITPSSAGEVIVAGTSSNQGAAPATVNNGFNGGQGVPPGSALSQLQNGNCESGSSAYLIDSSAAPINVTITSSANTDWSWAIASFSKS